MRALVIALIAASFAPDLESSRKKLGHEDRRRRQTAIEELAALGSEDAWELVFSRGLVDPSPRVADEAQLRIGGASAEEPLIELLEGKSGLRAKSPLVRARLAEALGRMEGSVPVQLFATLAKDRDAEVRASAWYAAERRGATAIDASDARQAKAFCAALLKSARSDRSPRARANALRCAAALGVTPWVADEVGPVDAIVEEAASDDEPLVRAAAVAIQGTHSAASNALADTAPGVVATGIDVLASLGDKPAATALAARLTDETTLNTALTDRLVQSLQELSGLEIGAQGDAWQRWAADLADDWRAKDSEHSSKRGDDERKTTTFFGLRIRSDALVYLVDFSGSMWSDKDGPPRKQSVDIEIERSLGDLPETARFDLVPYADEPQPWKGELTPATERNTDRAAAWFHKSKLRGKGDFWTALVPVLENDEVDTAVVMTDGAPTGGDRWNLRIMRDLLNDRNRHRKLVIHVVLFDASKGLEKLWRGIAEDSGGTLVVLD